MTAMPRGIGDRKPDEITLRDVITYELDLVVECGFCSHKGLMDTAELVLLFGSEMTMTDLPRKVRCRKCRRLGGHEVLFKTGEGKKDWWPRQPEARR
jgi:hypothetical protein